MPAQTPSGNLIPDIAYESGLPGDCLSTFISRFVTAAKEDPFSTWLILPTERLVSEVKQRLMADTIPFLSSRICTPEGFCAIQLEEHRTTERIIPENESKMLLSQILEDNAGDLRFFVRRGHVSTGTVRDLRELMKVIRLRKIVFPECLLELESEKSRQLDAIITEYTRHLRETDLYDSHTLLEWTIDHLNRSGESGLGTVVMYGFHDLQTLEQDLVDTIAEHAGKSFVFVPEGIDQNVFRGRPRSGKQPGFDPASLRSRITGLFSETDALDAGDFFHTRTFSSRYAEISGIASEICRLNREGMPLSDIAVVFYDLRDNRALIEEIFGDYGIAWNCRIGPPLSASPLIQFLTNLVDLSPGGYTRETMIRIIGSPYFRRGNVPGSTSSLDASEVDLVSRYARIDGPHPSWSRQLEWLRTELADPNKAKNFPGISVHTVDRVREGIRILQNDLDAISHGTSLQSHIRAFREFLTSWDLPQIFFAPDAALKEREIQIYEKFCKLLTALEHASWHPDNAPVDGKKFARMITSLAEDPDESGLEDADGVTVLGLWESQHMNYPVVFIGGLVEGVVPRLTTRLPFMNTLENARMGTRSLSEILREEQYYFIASLLSAQKAVYLSAPLADGEKTLLTSAFFERVRMRSGDLPWPEIPVDICSASLRCSAINAGTAIQDGRICEARGTIPSSHPISDLAERINMERYHRTGSCDSSYDGILSGDETIQEALAGRYGPDHVYSPTSLETYANCPFAYFLGRVINLKELPEVESNLSASDRGTAIHDILSAFYRQWRSAGHNKVSLASLNDATEMILKIASEELAQYSFQSPLWDATRILMLGDNHTGPGYFERFLIHEAGEENSPLIPSRFEFSFGMEAGESDDPSSVPEPVELVSQDGGQKMFIRGRIDRVDLTPDGQFVIYDYKSGLQHPKAKEIEAGTALQLPLYLLAFEKISGNHGVGGGYYKIRREIARSLVLADPVAKDLMISRVRPSADFAGTIRHSRDCAFAYIEGIRNGRFPLPAEEECPNTYCEFRQICRFDPYRVFQSGEET
ncbi:PD-(D/E)XK nuclease family protein [Methanoregula formicica]|uniref:PD-(D/E)XK endonuclease-like domain-containing protein n=1 Tax=Methanoregula formicica (strain DSM 22288 / NBRC 105244 / SMSP) TaxID=593750 RepID=L0HIL8_METFS|nr:PD-(D/E)XK nuclease family protein [Methanoregula formicica]AGB02924.1 hypothetical protein Metfor_1905 [Methanoregula formicica SMSP]